MEEIQPPKRNAKFRALIVLLLIITTVASCIGIYAWAKYITSHNENTTAQVAKWDFNLSLKAGGNTVTAGAGPIDLATTQYNHVANSRIAPGTSGEFDIIVDTTGTEVSLVYDVNISITDCPRNITFSKKGVGDADITVVSAGGAENPDNLKRTISFSKYIAVNPNNNNGVFTEKIYWDWPYEAGEGVAAEEIVAYDKRDTEDQEKEVKMNITVTGTEMLADPNELAAETPGTVAYAATHASTSGMARWQSVNYTPGTASISNDTLSIAGTSLNGTINAADAGDWVILDYDETTGEVKIIPKQYSSTGLSLNGMDGYNNAIKALDKVASIYKNDAYATSARSITVEDVNKVEGYVPGATATETATAPGGVVTKLWNSRYSMDENLNIVDNGEGSENVERVYTSTPETRIYNYSLNNSYRYLNTQWCWLASRCVCFDEYGFFFCVRELQNAGEHHNMGVHGSYIFRVDSDGNGDWDSSPFAVLPVVTLKSTAHMEKDSNDVWQLSL